MYCCISGAHLCFDLIFLIVYRYLLIYCTTHILCEINIKKIYKNNFRIEIVFIKGLFLSLKSELELTRPRGQGCVLGLKKRYRFRKRVTYFNRQTDRRTYPIIEMRERTSIISNEFCRIFYVMNVSFLHFSRKRYGPTDRRMDGRTDGRTYPLIEMRGRI